VGRALLVAHEDVADFLLLVNLVVKRHDCAARIAEHGRHPLFLEGLDGRLCT
jgi:hypothetical protein